MSPRLIDELRVRGYGPAAARVLLNTGKVFLAGVPTADGGREVEASSVEIRTAAARILPGRDLALLWHDRHLAVVLKPSGLLSVPAAGRHAEPSVLGVVHDLLGTALPVHRLDEPTSGLMMVALSAHCQRAVKEILFRHQIERGYLAIVRGRFGATTRTVRTTIVRDRGDGRRGRGAAGDPEGKDAVTHFTRREVLGRHASLVEARLETGRTHQVRVHLSELGFPILGDELYGDPGVARMAPRLALHAYHLALIQPLTGEALTFTVPLADDLEQLRRRLAYNQPRPRRHG